MINLLLSRSSDPVGMQVLVGIICALIFWFFASIFGKKKSSINNDSDLLAKMSENKKSYDESEKQSSKTDKSVIENTIRKFVRDSFDSACKEIVLSCQGLPKREQYVKISLKIQDFYAIKFRSVPGVENMKKMANDNGINWDKLLDNELKRAIEVYSDPLDFIG